jgi:exoribonuclease-2
MAGRRHDRQDLERIADRAMRERGFEPDFPREVAAEVARLQAAASDAAVRDLRQLSWCSIDNDDSMDLDQLSVAERPKDGLTRIRVAIADVDALVHKGSAIDRRAEQNTTSVYTAAKIYPMLPERLSTDLTSLGQDEDRLAVVAELVVSDEGAVAGAEIYRATVRTRAKLAYDLSRHGSKATRLRPQRSPPCPASTRTCAGRMPPHSGCGPYDTSGARSISRPSSRGRCLPARRSAISSRRPRTARAS